MEKIFTEIKMNEQADFTCSLSFTCILKLDTSFHNFDVKQTKQKMFYFSKKGCYKTIKRYS